MKHIVKRAGHNELYDERKLYASVFSACQAVREPMGSAELIADKVVKDVNEWLDKKHEVTSNDIRAQAAKHLHAYHADAAYIYRHHRVVW
jgi:transcriptional regulator NrdR family protein